MNEQEILDNAPKGNYKSVIVNVNAITWGPDEYRSLSDIKTIVEQQKRIEQLEKMIDRCLGFEDLERDL